MKVHIGKSKLHGNGLFASREIKKGEIIFIVKGPRINFLIDNKKQAKMAGLNWFGFSKNQWIDVNKNCCDYLNHSCNPNSGIRGRVVLIALKKIKKDTEITFDYSTNEADIFWAVKCNCGEKNCRKIIRSIQFFPKETFNKRQNHIPQYYKKVFKKFHHSKFKDERELKDKWLGFIKKGF